MKDESLFARIECYGQQPSKLKKDGRSMQGVAYEAERRPGYCPHVPNPKSPKVLYECRPSEAVRVAAEELRRYMKGEPLHNVVQAAI